MLSKMSSPQQQIIDKCRAVFSKAEELYKVDMSKVGVHFDLKGKTAGMAVRKGTQFYIRFNRDMLLREAFDHVLNDTVPHEIAHTVCQMKPSLGSGHDSGWVRVARSLGSTGQRCHEEEVVYGKGHTYEYTTSRGHKVRVGDKHHQTIQRGTPLTWRGGKGTVTKDSQFCVVGYQGRTYAAPVVKKVAAPVVVAVTPVAPTITLPTVFTGKEGDVTVARAIMLSGYRSKKSYNDIIAVLMAACKYTRDQAREIYIGNAAKVGIPVNI
jgi:predicted SprT family Zn-dependent metalloprotease